MRRRWTALLLCLLLLAGSGQIRAYAEAPAAADPEEAAPAGEIALEQARKLLEPWLEENCSFCFRFRLLQGPGRCLFEERIDQDSGVDDSFSFVMLIRIWDSRAKEMAEETDRFHYAREDGGFVCTMQYEGSPLQSVKLTSRQWREIQASRQQMIGVDTLLPAWAEDFASAEPEEEPELLCFRYALPLERAMEEENMLSQMLNAALFLRELDAYPEGLWVYAAFYVEKETLRPCRLVYDFGELIPCLFPEEATATEESEDGPGMEMSFQFDYDIPETVPLPETLREQSADLPEPGVVEDGEYRQPFFGLGFSVEDWELADRDEAGLSTFGIPRYASYSLEELLEAHIPYVELAMRRGGTYVYVMLEKPPITTSDGTKVSTPAEYMDADAGNLPRDYASIGLAVVSDERFQRELCGLSFEGYRIIDSEGASYAVLAAEKGGVFLTIIIDCRNEDETEAVLGGFFPLPKNG